MTNRGSRRCGSPVWSIPAVALSCLLAGNPPASAAAPGSKFFQGSERAAAVVEVQRLKAIQARHRAEVLELPGVISFGIGVDKVRRKLQFLVGVEEGQLFPPVPPEIEGVSVVVSHQPLPRLLHGGEACVPCHADAQPPPIEMGNQVQVDGGPGNCTLGFVACDRGRGVVVFVTNSHCATDAEGCSGGAALGTDAFHPSVGDTVIGQVGGHAAPQCERANHVDATKVDADVALLSMAIRDIGRPDPNPGTIVPGDPVQKSGRTTGLTFGEVLAVSLDIFGGFPNCCGSVLYFDQIQVASGEETFIEEGDSGSALLTTDEPPAIVGLLFGAGASRTAYANPIADVMSALNLDLNPLVCLCPVETAVAGAPEAPATLGVLKRLRDDVLPRSPRGKRYAAQFKEHSGEVALLLLRNPSLRERTRQELAHVLPIFEAIVQRRPVVLPRQDLDRVRALVEAYAVKGGPPLKAALRAFSLDLARPEVLAEFGVTAP